MARELSPHSASQVLANAVLLSQNLRKREALVIFVRVLANELLDLPVDAPFPKAAKAPSPHSCDLVEGAEIQPGDIVVTKRQWGAFYGTDLQQHLIRRGIKTIILGGIATNFGVESTARHAFDLGYELVFVEDAMSSINAEFHNFSMNHLFPRTGRVRTINQLLTEVS